MADWKEGRKTVDYTERWLDRRIDGVGCYLGRSNEGSLQRETAPLYSWIYLKAEWLISKEASWKEGKTRMQCKKNGAIEFLETPYDGLNDEQRNLVLSSRELKDGRRAQKNGSAAVGQNAEAKQNNMHTLRSVSFLKELLKISIQVGLHDYMQTDAEIHRPYVTQAFDVERTTQTCYSECLSVNIALSQSESIASLQSIDLRYMQSDFIDPLRVALQTGSRKATRYCRFIIGYIIYG